MRAFLFTATLFCTLFILNIQVFAQLEDVLMLTAACTSHPNISTDQTAIRFVDEATDYFDSEWDAYKFMNPGTTPNLYSQSDEQYAINALSTDFSEKNVVVNFKCKVNGTYTISADEMGEFEPGWSIILIDRFTLKEIDLRKDKVYSFTSSVNDRAERFSIAFQKPSDKSIVTSNDANNNLQSEGAVWASSSQLRIHLPSMPYAASITVCDLAGTSIIHSDECAADYNFRIDRTGVYFVKVTTDNKTFSKKVYVLN